MKAGTVTVVTFPLGLVVQYSMSGDDNVKTFMGSTEYVITFILAFLLLPRCFAARPCPFYQQGSCFFSDSCNFLHTVSATIIAEALPLDNHNPIPAATPTNLPRVIVDSVPSTPVPSPCHSPGTTSVLLALRLIDDPDVAGNKSNVTSQEDALTEEITTWSESLPTLVNEGFPISDDILAETSYYTVDDTDDYPGNWTAISDYNDLSPNLSSQNIDQGLENSTSLGDSEVEDDTIHPPISSDPESHAQSPSVGVTQSGLHPSPRASVGLLSPIELSTLDLGPFRLDDNVVIGDDNSEYRDNWEPPNPLLLSPPRSPSISSTFDPLSSPFGTLSSEVVSPYLGAFFPVSPTRTIPPAMLDEVPPLGLGLVSPQENTPTPLLDDVDNESPSCSSPYDQDLANISDSQIEDMQDQISEDFAGPDENYVREQVTAAIRHQRRSSPLHFLHLHDTNLVGDDALDHSSADSIGDEGASTSQPPPEPADEENNDSQISLDLDATAFLAYLKSPPRPAENDTLTSLYDIYSDIAPLKDVISDSIRNAGLSPPRIPISSLSNDSSPASSLRGRVFTPPPLGKKRSGTITAGSSASLSSPITSVNSPSVGRSSPFSVPDDRHYPTGRTESRSSQNKAYKKVPFGLSQSLALVSLILGLLQLIYNMLPQGSSY